MHVDCQLSNAHLLVRQGGSLAQIAQWQKVTLNYRAINIEFMKSK